MSPRTAFVLWCDDIRQEVGNKPSFMGAYVGGMTVPSLPFALQRLSVWLTVQSPNRKPIKEWSIRLLRDDGTELLHMPPTPVHDDLAERLPGRTMQVLMMGLTASPLEIPEGCRYFQLEVLADGEPLETGKLWVTSIANAAPPAATAAKKRAARKKAS